MRDEERKEEEKKQINEWKCEKRERESVNIRVSNSPTPPE